MCLTHVDTALLIKRIQQKLLIFVTFKTIPDKDDENKLYIGCLYTNSQRVLDENRNNYEIELI